MCIRDRYVYLLYFSIFGLFIFTCVLALELYDYACHIICSSTIWHCDISFGYSLIHQFFNYEWGLALFLDFFLCFWWRPRCTLRALLLFWSLCSLFLAEIDSFLICVAVPDTVTRIYYEIEIWLYWNLYNIGEGRNLVLLSFLHIPIDLSFSRVWLLR